MLDVLINRNGQKAGEDGAMEVSERVDKPIKSVLKSISWRIVGTIDTMIISYFITGKLTAAVSIGGVEVITKTILYYFHERLWAHIHRIKFNFYKKYNGKRFDVKRAPETTRRTNNRRIAANSVIPVSG